MNFMVIYIHFKIFQKISKNVLHSKSHACTARKSASWYRSRIWIYVVISDRAGFRPEIREKRAKPKSPAVMKRRRLKASHEIEL